MRALLLTLLILLPGLALGGGTSWAFQIIEFHKLGDQSAFVKMRAIDQQASLAPHCKIISLRVFHRPETYFFRTWSAELVTLQGHRNALDRLQLAAHGQQVIRVGEIGQGFVESDKCLFETRGLAELAEDKGSKGIYGFNRPI